VDGTSVVSYPMAGFLYWYWNFEFCYHVSGYQLQRYIM